MQPKTVLQITLAVAIAVSVVHYADNTLRFDDYVGSDPSLVTRLIPRWSIPTSWVAFTVAAVMGYRHFRAGRMSQAAGWLAFYSASGLIGLAHFVDVAPSAFTTFQLSFVLIDIGCGIAVLAFAVWTATRAPSLSPALR